MKYVVLSTDMAGRPKVDDVDSLDAAIQQVERLRNDDAVEDVRVLREVPIEVRTYYKVVALEGEETAGAQGGQQPAPAAPPEPPVPTGDAAATSDATTQDAVGEGATSDPAAAEPAEQPAASEGAPRSEPPADEGFFTPPPVRSHLEDAGEPAPDASPSERRTSLFGRG